MSIQRQPEPTIVDGPAVTRAGWERIAAISGALFAVVQIASTFTAGAAPPNADASLPTIAAYYSAHATGVLVTDYLFAAGAFLLLWFMGGLRAALQRTEEVPGMLSMVAFAAGAVTAGMMLVDAAIEAGLAFRAAKLGGDPVLIRALFDMARIAFDFIWIPAAALVLAASLASFGGQLLPRWLARSGPVVAAVLLLSSAAVFSRGGGPVPALTLVAFLLFSVWTLAVSVYLFLRASSGPRVSPG